MPDVLIENHGSIVLLRPQNETGRQWLADNLLDPMFFGPGAVVEPRYVAPIVEGMGEDGIEVGF